MTPGALASICKRVITDLAKRDRWVRAVLRRACRPLRSRAVRLRAGKAAGLRLQVGEGQLLWLTGRNEMPTQSALCGVVRPGDVVWDVGANVGFFSLLLARLVGPAGQVVAFEPVPDFARILRRNVELNRLTNVTVVEAALADTHAKRYIHRDPRIARLVKEAPGDAFPVDVVTADQFLNARSVRAPAVVRMDIEGSELEALNGMTRLIDSRAPTIVCDMHGLNAEIADLFDAHGYVVEVLQGFRNLRDAPWWVTVTARPRSPHSVTERASATDSIAAATYRGLDT